MAHERYEQMLRDLQQERAEAERQLAALQQRVDALRKATDGMEELLTSEREIPSQERPEVPPPPPLPITKPRTADGALIIIQSDLNRYWTVRDIWEAMVERGWAQDNKDARSAVRIALTRLSVKHAGELERVDAPPTHAYRWVGGNDDDRPASSQTSKSAAGLRMIPARKTEP
jgi:hypothetical protein